MFYTFSHSATKYGVYRYLIDGQIRTITGVFENWTYKNNYEYWESNDPNNALLWTSRKNQTTKHMIWYDSYHKMYDFKGSIKPPKNAENIIVHKPMDFVLMQIRSYKKEECEYENIKEKYNEHRRFVENFSKICKEAFELFDTHPIYQMSGLPEAFENTYRAIIG